MDTLVSITIPTYNNERTLERTLESVKNQTYKKIETILIDSNSNDKTLEIAKKYNVKIFQYSGTLLGARKLGVEKAKGKIIFLVDSDHILEKESVEKAVKLMEKNDMLWLYERSYNPRKFLEKIYDADRLLVQENIQDYIEPVGGTVLPRVYKKQVIKKGFDNIPEKILPLCVAHDHAIIYYECKKISEKIGNLGSKEIPAIFHQEPWSISNLFKKTYRYGITTRKLVENQVYPELLKSKNKGRKIKVKYLELSIKSNVLRLMRAIPYLYGYYTGKDKKIPGL